MQFIPELIANGFWQRLQCGETPFRFVGEQDNAVGVGRQNMAARVLPLPLELVELDLHDDDTRWSGVGFDPPRQVVAGTLTNCTRRELLADTFGQGRPDVCSEGVVLPNEAGSQPPVACCDGYPCSVDDVDGGSAGSHRKRLELSIGTMRRTRV